MYLVRCYNDDRYDEFVAINKSKDKAIDQVVKAYGKVYEMTDDDVKEMWHYKSLKDYILCERGLSVYKIDEEKVLVNGKEFE